MSGKWTKRGIEDSHGHLIADLEGTVVCTKRKEREEVPVGRMVLERTQDKHTRGISLPYKKGSVAEQLSKKDPLLKVENRRLKNISKKIQDKLMCAGKLKATMIARLQRILHEAGLAAPDVETLNSDKRFACSSHPDSKFLWKNEGCYETNTKPDILRYQRSCFECSLPSHFRKSQIEQPETKDTWAYKCPCCGIVPGMCVRERSGAYSLCENFYCKLCGKLLGYYVYDIGR